MSKHLQDFLTPATGLLALGEPAHREPAFALIRNELFAQLAGHGFRSIALETDRVAALAANDYVQHGTGTLESAMSHGFSHGFGDLDANRQLIAWMRQYNENRPPAQQLVFHGFDAATENTSAPSPRRYLEYTAAYLHLETSLASLAGEDEQWSRQEAVMDPARSPGATAEAHQLRAIADDMLTLLYAHAPELISATSLEQWQRAKTYVTTGLGLLRYHRQAAQRLEPGTRISRLAGIRDALMAQNLLDIRGTDARRGPTLVFAHNRHLQRNRSTLRIARHLRLGGGNADLDLNWSGAGDIIASLGHPYTFIAGSLGRSEALGLAGPQPDTYEGVLQSHISTWGLTAAPAAGSARTRTDTTPEQAYFPLDPETLDGADAVLHISTGETLVRP